MKRTLSIICAAIVIAACAKVSDTTVINGTFDPEEAPGSVYISLDEMGISDMVDVIDGSFTYEIPTDPTTLGVITTGFSEAVFIPDGTVLNVDFTAPTPIVSSDKPKISAQERYNELTQGFDAILSKEDISNDEEITNAVIDLCVDAVRKNPNDAVGLSALATIFDVLSYSQQRELIELVNKGPLKTKTIVMELTSSFVSGEATAEGKMFTDFTVVQDPDDPDGSTVKFSDYIGKGKYVLVDFWASWCSPCKAEMPNIIAAYDKYAGDKFDILSVAVWDEPEASKDAIDDFGIKWNVIINAQQIPTDIYGIDGIPHIILFGPDGTIIKRGLRGGMIDAELSKHLKPAK